MSIQINLDHLNTRANSLKTAGEAFTNPALEPIDIQSTLSIVQNSIDTHEQTNQNHMRMSEYLINSANLITDIGQGFFELDQEAASAMGIKPVK